MAKSAKLEKLPAKKEPIVENLTPASDPVVQTVEETKE